MKAATIVPQPYLHLIANDDYFMVLAHLVNKEGFEPYTEFYREMGQDPRRFLILDTGLIEGDPRPIEELVEKAAYLHADEMVLPDVFMNKDETLRESHEALAYVESVYPEIRLMAVPQGQSLDEWLECAKEMLTWPVHTIGIPKVLTKLAGRDGRLMALEAIQEWLGDKDVHMLGCWESPLELKLIENQVRAKNIKPVRGVDSAIAYVYARAGLRISEAERPAGAIDFSAKDADEELLRYNIELWKSECATLPPLNSGGSNKVLRIW